MGLGGSVPSTDFTLGDVVCATRVHDFCVRAVTQEGETYNQDGGMMAPEIQNLLSNLPAYASQLTGWNTMESIGMAKPTLKVPPLNSKRYYGDKSWRQDIRDKLLHHFPSRITPRPPIVTSRPVATSDALVKSPDMISRWQQSARSLVPRFINTDTY